jgi:hypothetical protein
MPESGPDQTLMALLALEGDDSSGAPDAAAPTDGSQRHALPTLDQRVELYLNAVYGPNNVVTAEMRAAAREHLLAAMAADLADGTASAAPEQGASTASVLHSVAAQSGTSLSGGLSQLWAGLAAGLQQLVSAAGELFTVRGMRMAAVPLVALLVVGSIWTKDWMSGRYGGEGSQVINPPAGNTPNSDTGTTRSLTPLSQPVDPAREENLKRAIAQQEAAHGPNDPGLARILVDLAVVYRSDGRYEAAEGLCKRALTIQQNALGAKDAHTIRTMKELAAIYRLEGRTKEADDLLSQAAQ